MIGVRRPTGLLVDYGGTLVEEVAVDLRAGTEAMLARAIARPAAVTVEDVMERAALVSASVSDRRDASQVETPWPGLTRLIHDYLGVRFAQPMAELELAFWDATVTTREIPGAKSALEELHRHGVPIAVVSNSSFGPHVIRHELAKHGLADHLAFIMVSAEYVVRKPHALLFETAAARLGACPADIWFVGDRLDTDIAGARAAGMTAVWFGGVAGNGEQAADLTVSAWPELVQRFQDAMVREDQDAEGTTCEESGY